jgi:antirestriction protein ArdC
MKPYPPQYVWTHAWVAEPKEVQALARVPQVDEFLSRLKLYRTDFTSAAYYDPSMDRINIPPEHCFFSVDDETATQAYYAVVFHELGHWTGHQTRLNRSRGANGYAREELVAEATAISLMRHFKLAPAILTRQAHYFQVWLSRTGDEEESLAYARREAERAVRFLLG